MLVDAQASSCSDQFNLSLYHLKKGANVMIGSQTLLVTEQRTEDIDTNF